MSIFERRETLKTFIYKYPAVTILALAIITIQLLTYLYGNGPTDYETARRFGAIQTGDTSPDQWFRLITCLFVQIGGTMHLLGNVGTLLILAPPLERFYGSVKFISLFFATGIVGSLFVLTFSENVIAAGASGSIYGLLGLYLGLLLKKNRFIDSESRKIILGFFILNIIITFVIPNISIAAHLGGLCSGFILSYYIKIKSYEPFSTMRWILNLLKIILVIILWFSIMIIPGLLFE